MTVGTPCGCGRVRYIFRLSLDRRGLMTLSTLKGRVVSLERKIRPGVVEPLQVLPGVHGMACPASCCGSIGIQRRFIILKLGHVRIFVALRAGKIFENVFYKRLLRFMAVLACDIAVSADHLESGFGMTIPVKFGRFERRFVMAAPAGVLIGISRKLSTMRIRMTFFARYILHPVNRTVCIRWMALRAGDDQMCLFQGKPCVPMFRDTIQRGIESSFIMAFVASPSAGPVGKLSPMGVLLMAISAIRKLQSACKISARMTRVTFDRCMLS